MARVTLLTDFGTADGYAAAMAGVIAAAAPSARVETASHDIAPGDIFGAALALSRYASLYPPGTVHVVVVDPGVGTDRRAIAATVDERHYVAPDNGVLTFVLRDAGRARLVGLDAPARGPAGAVSATFHGRDVFAPAAGRLARGDPLEALGDAVHAPVLLALPEPGRGVAGIEGEIIGVDRFGNLITNIPGEWAGAGSWVRVRGQGVGPLRRTYGDVEPGELVALIGSLGWIEVSVRNGNAADRLEAGRGARVTVREGNRR